MPSQAAPSPFQIGDRVRIDKSIITMPPLPSHVGVVKDIIPNYAAKTIGYNILLEGDPRPNRIWYFLQDQLTGA